jgi:hypothetical protein
MNNPDHISESLEKFWGFKYLNSLIADPGSGMGKFGCGIRDGKNSDPGSGINISDPLHGKKNSCRPKGSSGDGGTESFLESPEAAPFLGVFRNIRLPHLVNHHMDVEILVSDRIIPNSWMTSIYYTRWMTLLRYLQYPKYGWHSSGTLHRYRVIVRYRKRG